MRNRLFIFILAFAVLSACGGGNGNKVDESIMEQPLDVELVVPETGDVNGEIKMEALVTQGDDVVSDADEVVFEVWEEGKKDDSNMIESENNGDGTYTAETTFSHDGVFTIQVHVTARGLHTMPKKSVIVGDGAEIPADNQDQDHEHEEQVDGFGMHFMNPSPVESGTEINLMTHLQSENTPFVDADVRYEIWNESISDKREWVNAQEDIPGEYTTTHIFVEPGEYTIQIHVEDDVGLHEHEEHQVEVID